MSILSRADLLGATVLPQQRVTVPELHGDVIVRGMSGAERDTYEATLFKGKGKHRDINLANARARLVAACCIDEDGHRLFTDADALTLGNVRVDVLNRLFSVAQKLSGITDEDVDELGQPTPSPTAGATSSSALPES